MQENFTFTINESLFFDKQHQIKEMLGIGIEPVISIEETDNSLSIRGVMELKGEYVKDKAFDETENTERNNEYTYVEKVAPLSDDVNEFFHKLLVDITIPTERINSIDDVELEIDHFDYNLHSSEEMLIETTLLIHGINEKEVKQEIDYVEPLPVFEEKRKASDGLEEAEDDSMDEVGLLGREEKEEVEKSKSDIPEEETTDVKETQELETVDTREEVEQESETIDTKEEVDQETETEDIREEVEEEPDSKMKGEISEPLEMKEEKQKEKLQVRAQSATDTTDEEATYLLNIFQKDEGTDLRKLKLYIVQPNDQMENIASRYEVTSRQIMRANRLEDEDITAGQLIYIPINYEK